MPALVPTDFTARVTWLGAVTGADTGIASRARDSLELGFEGVPGERHAGLTRPSCARVVTQYPTRGTEIRNVRQLSLVSSEEMALIARRMGLGRIAPEWLGATMVFEGLADFTHLPPSSRLQSEAGVVLTIDMENQACVLPGREIEAVHPGLGKAFKPAAQGRRGVTAWVEHPGLVRIGDSFRLHVPGQPLWAHHEALR